MSDDFDIQDALRTYAAPVADDGFTTATLVRAKKSTSTRVIVLAGATCLGGVFALSQIPSLWQTLSGLDIPTTSPLALTALGLLSFVGWAALDRGWSDAV